MINALVLFVFALAAGLVIALGVTPGSKTLKLLVSFSGAFLLGITFSHLVPEIYAPGQSHITTTMLVMGGFLLQVMIEFLSQGIEHGHDHHSSKMSGFPYAIVFGLLLHAFFDGLPLSPVADQMHDHGHHHHHHHNHDHGSLPLLLGIIIHKIPVAMVFTILLKQFNLRKAIVIAWVVLFAAMAPLGILAGHLVGDIQNAGHVIMALSVGVFLHISTTILFESSEAHKYNLIKLLTIIGGMALAILSESL